MKESKNTDYIRTVQSKRIRECMAECGITGKEIAHELNYTPQHISYVLNGKRNLTVDMAVNLAQLFSKLRGYKMRNIEIPYSELSQEDKENLFNSGNIESLENGNVMFYYDDLDSIDYRYLLGEVDQKPSGTILNLLQKVQRIIYSRKVLVPYYTITDMILI